MQNLVRVIYSKGFDDSLKMPTVHYEIFCATACAAQNKAYKPKIRLTKAFKEKLGGAIPVQFQLGFCALFEQLVQLTAIRAGRLRSGVFIMGNVSIEHILPIKWKTYSGEFAYIKWWNEKQANEAMETLGNLRLLEGNNNNNLGMSDYFTLQLKSKFEATHRLNEGTGLWRPSTYKVYQHIIITKIMEFLESNTHNSPLGIKNVNGVTTF